MKQLYKTVRDVMWWAPHFEDVKTSGTLPAGTVVSVRDQTLDRWDNGKGAHMYWLLEWDGGNGWTRTYYPDPFPPSHRRRLLRGLRGEGGPDQTATETPTFHAVHVRRHTGENVTFHWIEQLDQDHNVVRVYCGDGRYVARVVVHRRRGLGSGDRTWRAEHRSAGHWRPLVQAPRGPWKATPVRQWRSPQAAMRVVELLFTSKEGEP